MATKKAELKIHRLDSDVPLPYWSSEAVRPWFREVARAAPTSIALESRILRGKIDTALKREGFWIGAP